ncbi:chromate transporter [Paenibacillus sp. OV219]|uniref:chromate transporter n=1 Tax=Paenibacillus sp. OV219 TaxID=1884377 RepID=UPI0008C495C9|nr:chromate transporter [Paenibacillus sp. OV219]SEO76415.1 chromate transporter [Paenibacillus sp. OV219]
MRNLYKQLVLAMARTGIVGFGGGPSVIPLIRYEAVTRFRWMSDDEFGEVLAIANTLPGPIATKIATYLGYRLKGPLGAAVSLTAHIAPSILAMIALFTTVTSLSGHTIVEDMIAAVNPVIAVMLGQMTYEFMNKAWKGLGKWAGSAIVVLAFLLLTQVHLHPAWLILAFIVYGFFHYSLFEAAIRRFSHSKPDRKEEASR